MNQTQEQQQERLQQLFDKACTGVIRQNCQAWKEGSCVYYDENTGNRCAVGHLGTEEQAKKWTEDGLGGLTQNWEDSWNNDIKEDLQIKTYIEWDLLRSLQAAHDRWSPNEEMRFIEYFICEADILANDLNLDTKVLKRSH